MNTDGLQLAQALLEQHRVLTLATLRPDGWPQATTLAFAHDGLTLYATTHATAQKVGNIRHDRRVSVTVDHDEPDLSRLQGLSMAAHAEVLTSPARIEHGYACLAHRFPWVGGMTAEVREHMVVIEIRPRVLSVIDYTRGFGHTDLIEL